MPGQWITALALAALLPLGGAAAEPPFTLATMPRIDVHTHLGDGWPVLDQVMELRQSLKQRLGVDMAMWISLGRAEPPDLEELRRRYQGRIQFCISDFKIEDGLQFTPQALVDWQQRGVMGFKFYPGWGRGVQIDKAEFVPLFQKMEEIGMLATSPHVANPCGTYGRRSEWFSEPVEFWRQQHAWENVLKRHPRLRVVNAHMLWLCYSDEQLDYLRYMLTTYPNLNIDLATSPIFLHAVGRDNLRDFMIEYADRILFGTDMASRWFVPVLDKQFPDVRDKAPQYQRYFEFLETDKELPSGINDEQKMRGLALPLEVLEKIYFRNAMRLYPHIKDTLTRLGYFGRSEAKPAAAAFDAVKQFEHLGIFTAEPKPGERLVEATKVSVTDFQKHPYGIEWLRSGGAYRGPNPHVAFHVENIERAAAAAADLTPAGKPFDAGIARVAFFRSGDGATVELMEYPKRRSPPAARKATFDHVGFITTEKKPGERFVAATKVWVTDIAAHPYRVEWLRFEPDSPVRSPVRDEPHAAFRVERIAEAARGLSVLIEPFDAGIATVGFYQTGDGAVVEFMEYK